LPKLNLDYPPARKHLIDAAKYWLSLGFDGFRLDHVLGPSHEFWQKFRKEIKKDYPNSILIGEAWLWDVKFNELKTLKVKWKLLKWLTGSCSDSLLKSYIGELDGILDFKFQKLMNKFIAHKNIFRPRWLLNYKLRRHFSKYPENYFLTLFLDNHDMDRFLFECKNDKEKLKEAAKIQFSINQPKIIYYGTEIGMTQSKAAKDFKEHGDLQARQPMAWKKQDKEILKFYKKIINSK